MNHISVRANFIKSNYYSYICGSKTLVKCLFVFCLFNDTMVSITDIRCHEDRHCRMRSLPKAPTHDQCRESNPRPLDLWSSALPRAIIISSYMFDS